MVLEKFIRSLLKSLQGQRQCEKLKRKCAGKSKFTARELRVPAHDKSAAAISRYETPGLPRLFETGLQNYGLGAAAAFPPPRCVELVELDEKALEGPHWTPARLPL